MKREIRTGPKRLRWTRRDWSGAHGMGQSRRWDSSDGKFKTEREARRAGLTGKATKHPGRGPAPAEALNAAHTFVYAQMWIESAASGRARASGEREAVRDSLANQKEE